MIEYSLISGSLPLGVDIDSKTGKINGNITYENIAEGPSWTSPTNSNLGDVNELEIFDSVFFTATPRRPGQEIVSYVVIGSPDILPWGLFLNPVTGEMSGELKELKAEQAANDSNTNPPQWVTPMGNLATIDELAVTGIQLSAESTRGGTIRYELSGLLPWGLTFSGSTGMISGTTAELKESSYGVELSAPPFPVWQSPNNLGSFDGWSNVTIQLSASASGEGRTIDRYILTKGTLPYGLTLYRSTGVLSGTLNLISTVYEPEYLDPVKKPVFSNIVIVNGQSRTITNGSLGSVTKGAPLSIQFAAEANPNQVVEYFGLVETSLPLGLTMDPTTGIVSGNLSSSTPSGVHTLRIRVVDVSGSNTNTTFKITVN